MALRLKFNTALIICAAFLFKLLFVNVGLFSSLNNSHANTQVKRHFTGIIKKRRKQLDPADTAKTISYASVEILEEDTDNEELFKPATFPLLTSCLLGVENKIKDTLKRISSFNKRFSSQSSERYLEYQVFRI